MAESGAKDWVLGWVEDLHLRAESKHFWKEEQEQIDLEMCCLVLSCSVWESINQSMIYLHCQKSIR